MMLLIPSQGHFQVVNDDRDRGNFDFPAEIWRLFIAARTVGIEREVPNVLEEMFLHLATSSFSDIRRKAFLDFSLCQHINWKKTLLRRQLPLYLFLKCMLRRK